MSFPRVKKRVNASKNKKKTWRKHIDITDVDDFLEGERLQERTGGLVAEKPDDKLFFHDKSITTPRQPRKVDKATRRRQVKPLKCHSNLIPDPKIKPARIAHNVKTSTKDRRHPILIRQEAEGIIPKRLQRTVADRKKTMLEKQEQNRQKHNRIVDFDLWKEAEVKPVKPDEYYTEHLIKVRVKARRGFLRKPSGLSSIEVPHPGSSYNPAYNDHQDLLLKANQVEEDKIKAEEKITRALDHKFPTKDKAPTHRSWIAEMSVGLYDEVEDRAQQSENQDNSSLTALSAGAPVRRVLKTRKQRNAKTRIRKEEKERAQEKVEKIRDNQFFRLRGIKQEIKREKFDHTRHILRKAIIKDKFKDRVKKLSKIKYEVPDLEVKLTDELTQSFRELEPEGNVFVDRFKSLQKRNMIESRKRTGNKRRYKLKSFQKRGHRELT